MNLNETPTKTYLLFELVMLLICFPASLETNNHFVKKNIQISLKQNVNICIYFSQC